MEKKEAVDALPYGVGNDNYVFNETSIGTFLRAAFGGLLRDGMGRHWIINEIINVPATCYGL